jgi:hypothetical protein
MRKEKPMKPLFEEHNKPFRGLLRFLGFILVPIGAIFALVGLVDFFGAFSGHGFPTKFWCLFVGMPMVAVGLKCLKAGFLQSITKYVSGETVPVATESVRHVADELRPTFKGYVSDLKSVSARETGDPVSRMRTLEELKAKGLISEAEYAGKRAEILRGL